MDKKRLAVLSLSLPILLLVTVAAYATPLTLTPVAPIPGPSFNDSTQFGSLIIGPISVPIEAEGSFSGTLTATAFQSLSSYTFVYRIEMDAPGDSVDTFELATFFPPDLAINEITAVGYNTYYTGLNPNAAPAMAADGSDSGYTFLDFNFKNPEAGDNIGLPAGATTELYITTTANVDINVVYAVFINTGFAVSETISGVVAFGPPPETIPEPASIALVLSGLAGIAGIARRVIIR